MTPKLTNGGENLILRAMDGDAIVFSGIGLGNGECPENLKSLTGLMNQRIKLGLEDYSLENEGYIKLKTVLQNNNLDASFIWTEVGIYAENPDGGEDVLYAYCHYQLESTEGQNAPSLIPKTSSSVVKMELEYDIFVGDAENCSAIIADSFTYATQQGLQNHKDDTDNPHEVTAAQIGLGNVPNVSTNNQTPTYTLPNTLTGLISGETLGVAFGKIAKVASSLISHLQDNAKHITNAERNRWNEKADAIHNHTAANIISGTLGIARGGTGGTTAKTARSSLGVNDIYRLRTYSTGTISLGPGDVRSREYEIDFYPDYYPVAIAGFSILDRGDEPKSRYIHLNKILLSPYYVSYQVYNSYSGSNHCAIEFQVLYLKKL